MKYFKIIIIIFSLLFFGCLLLNNKPGMGIQYVNNGNISILEIYDILKDNFPEYNLKLSYHPESSSFQLFPKWGNIIVKERHSINMTSEKYFITFQYLIETNGTFSGISISYYLIGENIYERINELIEPMNNIKYCLINNFPDYLNENNIYEKFQPIPIH
jgi:hypothetical protein